MARISTPPHGADGGSGTPAVLDDAHFTPRRTEETWVPRAQTFVGLDDADRQALSDWLQRAGVRGIDAMDLSVRPWGVTGAGAVVGVFEAGKDRASWLVVRHGSGWTLARCSDGFVSDVMASLPAILSLIEVDRALGESRHGSASQGSGPQASRFQDSRS
jgi:hypothetical protein